MLSNYNHVACAVMRWLIICVSLLATGMGGCDAQGRVAENLTFLASHPVRADAQPVTAATPAVHAASALVYNFPLPAVLASSSLYEQL